MATAAPAAVVHGAGLRRRAPTCARRATDRDAVVDAHDLVQEVWAIALPELHLLVDRPQLDGRTWLAFLARNPLYRCNDLLRRHIVRGIEQHAVNEIAVVLQISANLVSVRYRRALERLRLMLPEALLADLPDG